MSISTLVEFKPKKSKSLKKSFYLFIRCVWFLPLMLLFNNCDKSPKIFSENYLTDLANTSIKADPNSALVSNDASGSGTGNGSGYDGKLLSGTYVSVNTDLFTCEGLQMPKQILNVSIRSDSATLIVNEKDRCGSEIININKSSITVLDEFRISYQDQVFQKISAPNFPINSFLVGRCYLSEHLFLKDVFQFKIIFDIKLFKYVFYFQNADGKPIGNLNIDQFKNENEFNQFESFPYLLKTFNHQCQKRDSAQNLQGYLDCPANLSFQQNQETTQNTSAFCSFWLNEKTSKVLNSDNLIDSK